MKGLYAWVYAGFPSLASLSTWGGLLLAGLFAATSPRTAAAQEGQTQEEQSLLDVVQAPEGFAVTLFAAPPDVNYPAAITADPAGGLFVAVDRNGSLDQERGRGQIVHATDTDEDGSADAFTTFVDSVDSPRGLVYDGETLYVMHPPDLTAFRDTDGDGRAEEATTLIRGLGFDLDFRGADHTTNGIEIGIDGWIYVAVGDYGFIEAAGTDGTRLTHRGGAIVRVRPDGSEMEIVASGLRNVYDIALDPYLNGFVRGNTNDGGGWDVRLNRIVHYANYGYPSLFKNFSDEVLPPLADYGPGSGTGAYFLHDPGFPDTFNYMLYTADWSRSAVYQHPLEPRGASFRAEQESFLTIPVPTDLTVDGNSRMYVSSWFKGGFRYSSEDVGFIAQLTYPSRENASFPDLGATEADGLVELLAAPNHVHRLQAQQEILRRGDTGAADAEALAPALEEMAASGEKPLYARVAALFTLKQLLGPRSHDFLLQLADEEQDAARAFALRALADRKSQLEGVLAEPFTEALTAADPRAQLEAITGLARLGARDAADEILPLTASSDSVLSHVAMQALDSLRAVGVALDALDDASPEVRAGALQVLDRLHEERAVEGLITTLETAQEPDMRVDVLETLARLYHQEGDWERDDWWGTRPDTRGPYYRPVSWAQSEKIRPVLHEALLHAEGSRLDTLLAVFERNRVVPAGAEALILATAEDKDAEDKGADERGALQADLIRTLVGADSVTAQAVPLLRQAARRGDSLQAATVRLLAEQRSRLPLESLPLLRHAALDEALPAGVRSEALATLDEAAVSDERGRTEAARAFAGLGDPDQLSEDLAETWRRYVQRAEHVKNVSHFAELAQSGSAAEQAVAYAVLVSVAQASDGDGEAEKTAQKEARATVAEGWNAPPQQTASLLRAIGYVKAERYAERVRELRSDEDQPVAVQQAAAFAAERLAASAAETSDDASSSN